MNKLSISVGTESQYSATSSQYFEENAFKQQGGGIFSFLFGSEKGTYATELALRAFNDKVPQISCYVIKDSLESSNDVTLDYSKQEKNKRTLLHFLVLYSAYFSEVKQLLTDVLKMTDAKNSINLQDAKGNTCVHYALYLELDDVVKLLSESGADLSIKNDQGYYVRLEKVPVKIEPSDIFIKLATSTCSNKKKQDQLSTTSNTIANLTNKENESIRTDSLNDRLDNIVKAFMNLKNESDVETIGFNNKNITDSSVGFFNEKKNMNDKQSDIDTDKVMNMILNEFKSEENDNNFFDGQKGGSKKNLSVAGKKKKENFFGKRKMITYSEMSFGGSSENLEDTSDSEDSDFQNDDSDIRSISSLKELARAVNNKASEAHNNSILRIKELMKLDDEEAKAVKAILYEKIKKEKTELSNYDKAMELEKMASDESILKSIKKDDIKKMVKLIKDRQNQKTSSDTEKQEKTDKKRNMSRAIPYDTISDDSSSSSDSRTLKRSKKMLDITSDSSTSSSSSDE